MKKHLALGLVILATLGVVLGVACSRNTSTNDATDDDLPALSLKVTQPQDLVLVSKPTLEVEGVTAADAIVSVNGSLVDVSADGRFGTTFGLEQGPNFINVVASDCQGNGASKGLTVIYAP